MDSISPPSGGESLIWRPPGGMNGLAVGVGSTAGGDSGAVGSGVAIVPSSGDGETPVGEVGSGVGLAVGSGVGVGLAVGFGVGVWVGLEVGRSVGRGVGLDVGRAVGLGVGFGVGLGVGFGVGEVEPQRSANSTVHMNVSPAPL